MALVLSGDGKISGANLNIDSDGAATFTGLTVDTNTLSVDAVNNRVGIGTTTPAQEIHGYSSGGDFSLKLETASATGTAYTYYKNADREWATGIRGTVGDSYQIIDVNADAVRLAINTDGEVTMPYQPAFQVRLSNTQSLSGGGVRTKVAFDTIDYENGNNYSTANRRFTAPVTGFYQFNTIVYAYTVINNEVTLWKNGALYIRSQFEAPSATNPVNGVLVVTTKLTAGDYVEIYSAVDQAGSIYHSADRPSTWSGFLVG